MPKVKCGYCKQYLDKDLAFQKGIQFFHQDHLYSRKSKKITKKKDIPDDVRRIVLALDRNSCRGCGLSSNSGLHIHHVKYRSNGGQHTQENLITLCFKCHELVHSNKNKYQPLLFKIITLRSKGDQQINLKILERLMNEDSQQI